jgi:hypothetical protein
MRVKQGLSHYGKNWQREFKNSWAQEGRSYRIKDLLPSTKHSSGEQIKDDEMGAACGMHGREEKNTQSVSWKPERNRVLEDLCTDGRIILKWILNQ